MTKRKFGSYTLWTRKEKDMTKRKFGSYTLWMKWRNLGWNAEITCLNLPRPAANPIKVLSNWVYQNYSDPHYPDPLWKRGKNWMILGGNKTPKRR